MINTIAQRFWISEERKYKYGVFIGVFFYFCYWITNQGMYLSTPVLLPLFEWERSIPLLPASQWIYHLEVPFLLFIYYQFKEALIRTRFGFGMIALILFCTIVFVFYPTTYPREPFLLLLNNASFHEISLKFFWERIDQPANCFPSLHVATCYMVSFAMIEESKLKGLAAFLFSTAIAVSTLTTKQHYVLDVISGFILSFGIYYGFSKRIKSPL